MEVWKLKWNLKWKLKFWKLKWHKLASNKGFRKVIQG